MLHIRKSYERGYADHGWLKSFHSFSFASYVDPAHMQWGNLRVLNEDRIAPGTGFGAHPHRDMEIVSYVVEGALSHQDSMGNVQTILPGDVQRMTAGQGVVHSEHNHCADRETHFLQIWFLPTRTGLPASYEQKHFSAASKTHQLKLVASVDGGADVVTLNADVRMYACILQALEGKAASVEHVQDPRRNAYVFVLRGALEVAGKKLTAGDALLAENEDRLVLSAQTDTEFLLFDLASAD